MEDAVQIRCPWCGESFFTFVDPSQFGQRYIEDCQVCCRPIEMSFMQDEFGGISVTTDRE